MKIGVAARIGNQPDNAVSHLIFGGITVFMMLHDTCVVGLSPAAVGTILIATRLLDDFLRFRHRFDHPSEAEPWTLTVQSPGSG